MKSAFARTRFERAARGVLSRRGHAPETSDDSALPDSSAFDHSATGKCVNDSTRQARVEKQNDPMLWEEGHSAGSGGSNAKASTHGITSTAAFSTVLSAASHMA